MENRGRIQSRGDQIEKRLDELEHMCGALMEMFATMETAVQLLIDRGLISPQQLKTRAGSVLQSYGKRLSQKAEEEFLGIWESILDEQLEAYDEADLAHA